MRAAIYTRVSSAEQVEGFSLDAQRELCEAFARSRGWNIVNVYVEPGVSAKTTHRPEFQRMLADAERRVFDVIIVHKLDRFSRKLKDVLALVDQLEQHGVSLVSVSQNFDFTTPSGRLMLSMLGALAQWDNDNRAEETKKGQNERRNQGGWLGTLSFGYTTPDRIKRELLDLPPQHLAEQLMQTLAAYPNADSSDAIPHPIDSLAVLHIFELYATGTESYYSIAEKMNAEGWRIRTRFNSDVFRPDNVRTILHNRFYCGEIPITAGRKGRMSFHSRKWVQGNHPPIPSSELFQRVQDTLRRRNQRVRVRNARRIYVYTGILGDPSGAYWTGIANEEPRYQRSVTATAEWSGPRSISARIVEQQMQGVLAHLQIPASILDTLKQSPPKPTRPAPTAVDVEAKLTRLHDLYIDGEISKSDYIHRRDVLLMQQSTVESPIIQEVDITTALGILANISELWGAATDVEKRGIAKLLFERIEVGVKKRRAYVDCVYLTPLASLFYETYRDVVLHSGGGEPHQIRLLAIAA
jgi:DNA invertase Pin-like site-specific DNA recombinase